MTFSKVFSLSLSLRFELGSTSDFCRFLSFFLQGFSLQILVRPIYPSFCFYFLISCILIWGFWTCTYLGFLMIKAIFSKNWSLSFVPMMFLTWSLLENLINLEICEKSKFLGLVLNPNWGFVQFGLIWWNWLVELM